MSERGYDLVRRKYTNRHSRQKDVLVTLTRHPSSALSTFSSENINNNFLPGATPSINCEETHGSGCAGQAQSRAQEGAHG